MSSTALERIKDAIEPATGSVLDMTSGILLDGTVGVVVPGVGNMILSYKQKRLENNIEKALSRLVKRQDELNEKLQSLEENKARIIEGEYFDMMLDYAAEVRQQEKINYIVNGFINISDIETPRQDVIMMYYDTLQELTLLDIRLLRFYYNLLHMYVEPIETGDSIAKIMEENSLGNDELRYMQEKLQRHGLIESRNDIQQEENIKGIIRYLNQKDKKLKAKPVSKYESYKITRYGKRFMEFFIEGAEA